MREFLLDGAAMTDRPAAHAYLAETLKFPLWYGRNLDALADCLSEFGKRTRITIVNTEALRQNLGSYGERLLNVFREASAEPESFSLLLDPQL